MKTNTPASMIRLILFILFLSTLASPLHARVGEERGELERRLLRESDRGLEVTDNDLEQFYRNRSPFFEDLLILQGQGLEYAIYYKSADDLNASSNRLWQENDKGRRSDKPVRSPEGWMLHVVYLNGVSVLEFYQRSEELTVLETEGILMRNAGNSRWVKGEVPKGNDSVIEPTTFSANHYREDFAVYANVEDETILLFDPRLDARIAKLRAEKAEREAPSSLEGF